MIIDGKQIAKEILETLKSRPVPKKFMAGILIGDDPASVSFQKIKEKTAGQIGVDYRIYKLSPTLGNDGLRREVGRITFQKSCGGVIVQLPVPEGLNAQYIVNVIPPEKDVDVLSERSLGAFYAGRGNVLPPAVATVKEVLEREHVMLAEKNVAVVGLGFLVGRPIATWLMRKCKNLFLVRRGSDFSLLKNVDIVISGAGSPGIIRPEILKDDALVIDFGYGHKKVIRDMGKGTWEKQKLVGDFDASPCLMSQSPCRLRYTPTPHGTGPILVTKLFENFYKLNTR